MTNFPASLDSFTDPTASTLMDAPGQEHDVQHANLNDAVAALQAKVGINASTNQASMDWKLTQLVNMLLGTNSQVQIAIVSGQAQLQIWDAGYGAFVPILSNNGVLATGAPNS